MQSKKINLKEHHDILLNILCIVDDFCQKRNLRYSLAGGTLLGAVRHHGFIPWDDDIDIMMPREDYDIFSSEFNGYCDYLRSFTDVVNKENIIHFFWVKVEDVRTVMTEKGMNTFSYGVNIDVFPIDGFPDNSRQQKSFVSQMDRLRELFYLSTQHYKQSFDLKRKIKIVVAKIIGEKRLLKLTGSRMTKYSFAKSQFVGAVTGRYGLKEIYPRYVFDEYEYLDFENRKFMCISAYDAYLKQHYGDYMKLPKESERVTHSSKAFWK